jgi:hypothetical protein
LVAEDTTFAAQMERLFEEDLADAREVRLVGSHRAVRPDRRIDTSNRGARRGVVGSGSGSSAIIVRLGSAALQKSGAPLRTYEHALVGTLFGALGVVRAARFCNDASVEDLPSP